MNRSRNVRGPTSRAFTLAEMLVVIAIIVALIAIVLGPLRSLRAAGVQTETLNQLRQLSLAYRAYTDEYDGRLMPGYLDGPQLTAFASAGTPMWSKLPSGIVLNAINPTTGLGDSGSYVWRIAPYLDHTWETLYAGLRSSAITNQLQSEFTAGVYGAGTAGPSDLAISERPAYGVNAIFLGGDSRHGGPETTIFSPWNPAGNPAAAATRLSQVKRPSKVIVFAPTAKALTDMSTGAPVYDDERLGFAELRPPFTCLNSSNVWVNCQWRIAAHGLLEKTAAGDYAEGAGLPICRHINDRLAVANLDGSAEIMPLSEIARDMTRWSPFEVARRQTDPLAVGP